MANELKGLSEKKAELVAEANSLIAATKDERRAFTEEENTRFTAIEEEIKAINNTMDAEKRAVQLALQPPDEESEGDVKAAETESAKAEERAFTNYVYSQCGRAVPEIRADEQNLTMGNNGAIIPTSIANRIITTVKEMCPILSGATIFAVKGTLKVPVWGDADGHNITVGFQDEFTELTADSGKFTSVDLTGYLAGALTLIGKSVINNSEINVVDFIVGQMSKEIALFLEKTLLAASTTVDEAAGTSVSGALSTTTTVTAASATAITADELITIQAAIPTAYQAAACWTMNPSTFTAIKKLKDSNGQYLLQTSANIVGGFPYTLLGKPVYLSDNMPAIATGEAVVLYGDYSGLGVNFRQQIDMQVLNEKYATQHAVGLVAWFEFDSKVIDNQKLATLVMA